MKNILSKNGIYVFLIPLFFVLHGYVQNFGLIEVRDCLSLLLSYFVSVIILYLFLWLLYRNHLKASLLTGYIFSFYLFFGAIDDFFKAHIFFMSRYVIIIPIFIISVCCVAIYLKKTGKHFYRLSFFINILLLIYILVDAGDWAWKSIRNNTDKLSIYGNEQMNSYRTCSDCKNPDIYFLLFDEYGSSFSLRENFNYNNAGLDSFLIKKGFSIQTHSHSNYNFTSFSMASILNLNYISGIKNVNACTIQDYANCNNLIRNNEVIRFLSSRQYDIINYSIFDLAGNPTMLESSLLPIKTRLISEQTLYNRMVHDIGWNLYTGKFELKWLTKNIIYGTLNNNNKILALVNHESSLYNTHPRFVYAHFEMPHPPFYYDRNFQLRDKKELAAEQYGYHIESYKGYIPYTNRKIEELIDTIQNNTQNSAVIILMGDHGYRVEMDTSSRLHHFSNLNAVYFPNREYQFMTDSINGVNQFRAILNTLFKQQLPLLKDSLIFLTDKKVAPLPGATD
ncbi:MAG TPA: sulfatase-like hydrolase/transferase [Puia sp.]